jgi:hypothetical protein
MNLSKYLNYFFKPKDDKKNRLEIVLQQCGCVCYCPNCNDILNDQNNCIKVEDGVYRYTCTVCTNKSIWNFYIAPIPLCIIEKEN